MGSTAQIRRQVTSHFDKLVKMKGFYTLTNCSRLSTLAHWTVRSMMHLSRMHSALWTTTAGIYPQVSPDQLLAFRACFKSQLWRIWPRCSFLTNDCCAMQCYMHIYTLLYFIKTTYTVIYTVYLYFCNSLVLNLMSLLWPTWNILFSSYTIVK